MVTVFLYISWGISTLMSILDECKDELEVLIELFNIEVNTDAEIIMLLRRLNNEAPVRHKLNSTVDLTINPTNVDNRWEMSLPNRISFELVLERFATE